MLLLFVLPFPQLGDTIEEKSVGLVRRVMRTTKDVRQCRALAGRAAFPSSVSVVAQRKGENLVDKVRNGFGGKLPGHALQSAIDQVKLVLMDRNVVAQPEHCANDGGEQLDRMS